MSVYQALLVPGNESAAEELNLYEYKCDVWIVLGADLHCTVTVRLC